ncbi:DUF485 domain-containing protein [Streptomyces sp. TRM 70361]|uniref:DUF485 domain-containing protein n=1 Tax=Streptomyces sp. TRM 70361 TaxID=3116553 RepID=UPI002E7B5BC2|nr:DUF485 domain-containing protein [Streptomyces sp. TRM 70361]MEE1940914.1 DUF485 domain-containing protein [Streptomyces sp. TRM 70361]
MRIDDPWYDALASGWGERYEPAPPAAPPAGERPGTGPDAHAAAWLAVHRGAPFRELRRRHRRSVLATAAAFLPLHLAYAATAVTAPGLMARPLDGGPLTVGVLAWLVQFAAVLVPAGAYARHARLYRDGTALELRWQTEELLRAAERTPQPARAAAGGRGDREGPLR